jgi:hypothetical protein
MSTVPDHPVVNDVLAAVKTRDMGACVTHDDVLACTGPLFVTDVFDRKRLAGAVVWLPNRLSPDEADSELLRKLAASVGHDTLERQRCREQGTVAVHYWDNSWVGLLAGGLVNPWPYEKQDFVFHPGWDSPGHDLYNAGRLIESTAETCRRESRAVAFNTDGFLKTWIAPPFLWERYRGGDPREGLYVRNDWSAAKSLRDWRSMFGHLRQRLGRWRR